MILSMIAYPQMEFAEAIATALTRLRPPDGGSSHLLDAPCGSGETTFWLAQHFPQHTVIGSDLDATKIACAQRLYRCPNLRFETLDIFDLLLKIPRLDVFCLINSLFMLPRADELLRLAAGKMDDQSALLCIIPNTESRNFRIFQQIRPDINQLIIKPSDIASYFRQHGLRVVWVEGIVFQGPYEFRWLKLLGPRFRSAALRWCHLRQSRRPKAEACYFLVVLRKNIPES
jgi:SAM-dependent methyltransferase